MTFEQFREKLTPFFTPAQIGNLDAEAIQSALDAHGRNTAVNDIVAMLCPIWEYKQARIEAYRVLHDMGRDVICNIIADYIETDPAFIEKLDAAKRDLLEQSTVYIQGIVSEAITKMRDIMNDPDAPQQTQLNAAECLLRNCYKLTETSTVLEDIAELKKAVFPDE